jgi:ketosteroid isomerase-like protein
MARDAAETVRAGIDAYRAGDLAAMASLLAPGVEWKQVEEAEAAHGPEEVLEAVRRWEEDWETLEATAEEFVAAGDQVFVALRFRGRGKGSGVTVEQLTYLVYAVADGLITRMHEYGQDERAAALKAAGLPES